ncbi:cupin domain-containing protein [Micromonospora sp. NPDC005710]|uniref:cupin domain-containing protein n=1 Tax=Micromonospora sp. NPDC005710 TaxID=3157051 RepID=UPI003407E04F
MGAPGEVVADIGGESYTLTAGESVTFDSRLAHPYRNASEQPAHLIIAVTPPTP